MEIKVPQMGESITEATVADWRFNPGDAFGSGEILLELETDKVTLEVPAPVAGVLTKIKRQSGETVHIGDILGLIEEGSSNSTPTAPAKNSMPETETALPPKTDIQQSSTVSPAGLKNETLPPGAARLVAEHKLDPSQIEGSGKRDQVTKADVIQFLDARPEAAPKTDYEPVSAKREQRVPMSRLRQRIAERLVEAQHTAAILTTFNEIDMHNAIELRRRYKEQFKETYGVSLGLMSIFIKAAIHALKAVPVVNTEIQENSIIYKNYYDIGVAVGGPKGLVVPVIRNADHLSFAEIEEKLARLSAKVREGTIELPELEGGTFTISNGGIYGSMLSTPILNPPQSGILGMHKIMKRPYVIDDQILIRPLMFVALSYDHRIIDGKEAVSFLVKLKEAVEAPERMLIAI